MCELTEEQKKQQGQQMGKADTKMQPGVPSHNPQPPQNAFSSIAKPQVPITGSAHGPAMQEGILSSVFSFFSNLFGSSKSSPVQQTKKVGVIRLDYTIGDKNSFFTLHVEPKFSIKDRQYTHVDLLLDFQRMLGEALRILPDGQNIKAHPTGATIVKLETELLALLAGDGPMSGIAIKTRNARRDATRSHSAAEKTDPKMNADVISKNVIPEHMQFLQALAKMNYSGSDLMITSPLVAHKTSDGADRDGVDIYESMNKNLVDPSNEERLKEYERVLLEGHPASMNITMGKNFVSMLSDPSRWDRVFKNV
ncbi:MAG: hypothetical protein LBT26_10325 [Clostridiales Family XIII bacterium]|jgi:hypothetical protein|nr:hypothetical protein [Clostridiales Family XIII bacterium]